MENNGRIISEKGKFFLTIERLCHELHENHGDFKDSCVVGIQPRGTYLAQRMYDRLTQLWDSRPSFGKLDVTFHRDDFRRRDTILIPNPNEMDFVVEGKKVILVDDVLYTGRTVRAALTAIQHYGRPAKIELVCLIDRRFNRDLPIVPDYVGMTIDAVDEAHVRVEWSEIHGQDRILLFPSKQ